MSSITNRFPAVAAFPTARTAPRSKPRTRRRRSRRPPVWRLAAGYRLMAWRALRAGNQVDARMYNASSRALLSIRRC